MDASVSRVCLPPFLSFFVVDCWDGPQGEPVVFHGRTLTSKIPLRDVLESIQKYSFVVSDYPVVLSFEIHCSLEQQLSISSMLRRIFEKSLFVTPDNSDTLPSLKSLSRRTLVKAKILQDQEDDEGHRDEYASPDSSFATDEGYFKRRKSSFAPELLSLLCLKTRTFTGFEVSRESFQFDQMSSIGERRSVNLALKHRSEYVKHNSRFLTRVYPSSLRINSSNFDPVAHWKSGCQVSAYVNVIQMVALNYQTFDRGMQLNQSLFALNGGCGYVLKPEYLLHSSLNEFADPAGPLFFKVTIISAQHLPKPKNLSSKSVINPFIELEIVCEEGENTKLRTRTIYNNALNPIWNESFSFSIEEPDFAFLRFSLNSSESPRSSPDFIASFTILIGSLEQGYRHAPIYDSLGELVKFSSIFLHIKRDDNRA